MTRACPAIVLPHTHTPCTVHREGAPHGRPLRPHMGKPPLQQRDVPYSMPHPCQQVDAFIFLGVFGPGGGVGSSFVHAAAAVWVFWASTLVLVLVVVGVVAYPQVLQVTCVQTRVLAHRTHSPAQDVVDGFMQWLHTVAPDSYR